MQRLGVVFGKCSIKTDEGELPVGESADNVGGITRTA